MNKQKLEIIAQMTEDNNHGGVREFIAQQFGYCGLYAKQFFLINELHNLSGSIDLNLSLYRTTLTNEMFYLIGKNEGAEVADQIKACL